MYKLILLALLAAVATSQSIANMNFSQICQSLSYPVETHYITTEDQYVLTFFRVQAKYSNMTSGLPVIYFQHGLLDSSDTWIINNESLAPGFMAANRGYDVWFGNSRGNKYSLTNNIYNTSNVLFWNFTWQGMSADDLPAAMTYINQQTSQQINYIGHSQGTAIMFAALSRRNPVILQTLKTFCALGPIVYVNHQTSEFLSLLAGSIIPNLIVEFGVNDFLAPDWETSDFGEALCTLFDFICSDLLGVIADANPQYDNVARFPVIMGHFPAGTSTLDMLHFRQMVLTPQNESIFQQYNYGTALDELYYGQPTPPLYDPANINFPVNMFVGAEDRLADPTDATDAKNAMTGTTVAFNLYPNMGHASFIWGLNMSFMNDVFAVIQAGNEETLLLSK
jgi:gastric triacylglycerol lipase